MSEARHAVITGSAGGIGRALAEAFLGGGWFVTGVDVAQGSIAAERYQHRQVDIADEVAFDKALSGSWMRHAVHAVIGNAALTDIEHHRAIDIDYDLWRRILRVNIDGAFLTGRLAGRRMVEQGYGNIIFVTSSLAFLDEAKANDAAYCTSKAGVEMLARVLALELRDSGVNVNTLFPSVKIDTGFFAHLKADERAALARPDILNESALFLASLPPGSLTGHSLDQHRWDHDPAYRARILSKGEVVP